MKMTKNLKKLLALSVGASMTLSLCTGLNVSAQPFSQPDVINVFDTLYGYSKTLKQQSASLPANLTVPAYQSQADGVASDTTDPNDTAIKIVKNAANNLNGASLTCVFDEVIRKGTITISFDMKFPWNSDANDKNSYFYIERVPNLVNDNPTDYFLEEDAIGIPQPYTDHQRFMSINESGVSDGKINAGTSGSDAHNVSDDSIANKWHRYTITYNAETSDSVLYLDGGAISSRKHNDTTGTKRININTSGRANAVDNEILIDNIYIRHSQSELGEIPAKADYAKGGVALNGGVVKMAMAETINAVAEGAEYETSDFELKNSKGDIIDGGITKVEGDPDKPEIKFTLGNLEKGSYTIGLKASTKNGEFADYYKGKISGKFPEVISFSTEGDEQNKADKRRYYVNENFDGYNGGLPNGVVSDLFGLSKAQNMTKATDDTGHGNNLAINTRYDMAIWRFDEAIKGGVFNIEFDVKSNGGKWGLHLLKARDFLPQNYVPGDYWETLTPGGTTVQEPTNNKDEAQYSYYEKKLKEAKEAATAAGQTFDKDAWLVNNWVTDWQNYRVIDPQDAVKSRFDSRQASMRRSHVLGTTMDAAKYSYSTIRSPHSTYGPTYVNDKDIDPTFPEATSDWTHIKVKVDTEAAKYYLTVGDRTVELPYDQRNFNIGGSTASEHIPGYATSYDINTGKLKITPGFGGIGFYTEELNENQPIQFDNVKVYTEDSYNSYSNFDNACRGTYGEGTIGNGNPVGVDMPNWFIFDNLNYTLVERAPYGLALANGTGKSGEALDKALMINCGQAGAGSILNMLNVPIKSGREFNVEFDYKCSQEQSFMLGLVESGNILPYKLDNAKKLDGSNLEGKIEDTKGSTGEWNDTNLTSNRVILMNSGDNSAGVDGKFGFRNGSSGYFGADNNGQFFGGFKTAVSKDDETKKIDYKKGQWHHIKLNVKPNGNVLQETLEITYEDDTKATSQAYDTNLASANDIAALVFRFNDAQKFVSASNSQHFIDNLAVYEVGDVNNTYLTNVSAIDADGTESVIKNDSCKATTKQLKLNFSGKLSSAKGITITSDSEKALTPTYTLSDDKTSVLVSFNRALLPSEKINVSIGSNLDIERTSYLQMTEPYSAQISVEQAEGTLKLGEARLYKWVDSRTRPSIGVTTTAGYYPMGAEVLNDVTSGDKFKLVVKGTNFSGEDYQASIMQCVYDSNNRLIDVIITKDDTTKINQGVFDISKDNITCANANAAKIKFYVWRDNTLIPVANYLDYDVTTTAAEQPTE